MSRKRDKLFTLYGRKPALEALESLDVPVVKVWLADNARGEIVERIAARARERGAAVERTSPQNVSRISGNGRQDQGVAVDVAPPLFDSAETHFAALKTDEQPLMYAAFDRLTTPANLGLCIRTGLGAGVAGFVVPYRGVCELNAMVVKASAGTALRARILRCLRAEEGIAAAKNAGLTVVGLNARATQ
ncbi:MAG: RNA methyltransferase, partial [Bacteroidia bacterium]|nr:RNA methyltransferase [Bacteroidia bacterium]